MAAERVIPPLEAGERQMLSAWLDLQRATLAMKCDGLSDEQLRELAVPPSSLSLLGLVRHMAEVEASFAAWRAECDRARELADAAASLEVTGMRGGSRFSLRWVMVHMIE